MQVLKDPSWEEALAWLAQTVAGSVSRKRTVLVVGACRIRYKGRAESKLGLGERVILLKGDGTLLVHNPHGVKPVNWQPAGATFGVEADGQDVVLVARRRKPAELVRITFTQVRLLVAMPLKDEAVFTLSGSEFDLRDLLYAQPHLVEEGFRPWRREKVSERGPMDLYGEDAQKRRLVVELKRTRAGIAEATQLWRYVEKERSKRGVEVRGLLMAPAFSKRCRLMLAEHGLEAKAVEWDDVRPGVGAVEEAAQATLASFARQTDRS